MTGAMSRPSLIQRKWWERRRAHYEAVFDLALTMIRERPELWADEPNLVRELRVTSVTARRKLDPKGRFGRPDFESQNIPDPESDCVQPFEHKRPDIQWRHDDETAEDDRFREKSFVIECKRLGAKTDSGWDLNKQYVICGVLRFVSDKWKYGHGMSEGMMIGFVQNMEPAAILTVLNEHLSAASVPSLRLDRPFVIGGVTVLRHELTRSFRESPFQLAHRWIDIRDVPQWRRYSTTSAYVAAH